MSELETSLLRFVRVVTWAFVAYSVATIVRIIWLIWESC